MSNVMRSKSLLSFLAMFLISSLIWQALNMTVPSSASAATQATYYVSPSGNDNNPGTFAAPFRTLERARDVVRTINGNMTGDIIVYLRGGNYPITNTIDFTPSDSGTNGYRVIYQAYANEKPVLNAGVQVTGWTQHSGNIWKAPLNRNNKLRALYVNGKRAVMATKTVTSAGCYGNYSITANQAPWAWESGSHCDGARYNLNAFPAISLNQEDIEIETRTTWTTSIVGVRQVTVDGSNRVALFQQPGAAIAQGAFNGNFQINGSHKLMNAYEFLDTPGEFYFDKTNKMLYYYKSASENMTTATVFAPNNVETILNIKGDSTSNRVRNLTFSGITLLHSDWNLTEVAGSVFKQAQQGNLINSYYARQNFHVYYYRNVDLMPGIVKIANADGILLERNIVKHTGADGINLINDVSNSALIGNYIHDIAGSAITVGHPQHVYIGDYTPANREMFPVNEEAVCKNIDIKNNYIYDAAVLFNGSAAVAGYFTDTLNFQYNVIEKTPWAGISLGWGWWNFDGSAGSIRPGVPTATAKNNNISHNRFIDTVQVLDDTAPIYTLGNQPITTINDNYIRGVPAGHKYGMHPDEGSAYITMQNNVLSINPGLTWTLNSDDWGRKHDLTFTQNYANVNKISNYNLPNSTIHDVSVYADSVWPVQAYNVALNAGLEEAYRDIEKPSHVALQDEVLPASVFAGSSSVLGIRSAQDASKTVWLAPPGTTQFAEGATMTKASGNATSITVPQAAGDYKLYIVDAQGNRSPESVSLVRVTSTGTYEAEAAQLSGGAKVSTDLPGYTGTGYVDGYWNAGATTTFTVNVDAAGTYNVTARYGNAQYNPSTVSMIVNGTKVKQAAFPRFASWDIWGTQTETLTLNAGTNTIAYKYDTGDTGWINIDHITVTPVSTGYVRLRNVATGLYIDGMGSTSYGADAGQWGDSNSYNQQWLIEPNGNYVMIKNRQTGLYLDGMGLTGNGDNCGQWGFSGSHNQQWTMETYGNYVRFKNRYSGLYLDGMGRTDNGAILGQWGDSGSTNQQWEILQ